MMQATGPSGFGPRSQCRTALPECMLALRRTAQRNAPADIRRRRQSEPHPSWLDTTPGPGRWPNCHVRLEPDPHRIRLDPYTYAFRVRARYSSQHILRRSCQYVLWCRMHVRPSLRRTIHVLWTHPSNLSGHLDVGPLVAWPIRYPETLVLSV